MGEILIYICMRWSDGRKKVCAKKLIENVWRELTWSVNVCRTLHRMALFAYGIHCRYWKKKGRCSRLTLCSLSPLLPSLHLSFPYFSCNPPIHFVLPTWPYTMPAIYFEYVGKVLKCQKTYCKWDECQGNWFVYDFFCDFSDIFFVTLAIIFLLLSCLVKPILLASIIVLHWNS